MSPNSKLAHIHEFRIPRLFARRQKLHTRKFRYCDETHGAILNALLARADKPNDISVVLSQDFDRFRALMEKCNLGPRGRGYRKTNLPTIRRCIDWVRAQALQYGALVETPDGLVRPSGISFRNDEEATEWLDTKIIGRVQYCVSPSQHENISPVPSPPALETLSLSDDTSDDTYAETVTKSSPRRRVSFYQSSSSRSKSPSRTRRFERCRTDDLRGEGRALKFQKRL
ncbi:hypothetical protein CEP54_009615 [Fusarium duplospermum]|uniref:Uncharacterized protein n=1 Tax=Fusarium duplospermum TaxID=1325734 RepID=A0A428PP83_9HYPO|nr:hypothetical protein CEP54_009615 [Fusarium duplospermum]